MTDFERVMVERDGYSEEEARTELNNAREMFYDAIENGDSYDEIEDLIAYEYGLEMDYVLDLI